MKYRRLGKAGLKVSELSLGSWVTFGSQVDEQRASDCMVAAYDAGVNFFDGAEVYAEGRAEQVMGRVIKTQGWRREGLVLSTKIFWGGSGPNDTGLSHKRIIEGVNNALRRWQTDYLDLAFCHRPDPNTPIEETVRAMDILVKQGKVFYWGTSEWSASEIATAIRVARKLGLTPPTMEQPQYNLLNRERFEKEYTTLWSRFRYGATTWSPLASGLLSGKYNAGVPADARLALPQYQWLKDKLVTAESLDIVRKLGPIAESLGCTMSQFAIAWCLTNQRVSTVITGASSVKQVHENLKSAEYVEKFTPDVVSAIKRVLKPISLNHAAPLA